MGCLLYGCMVCAWMVYGWMVCGCMVLIRVQTATSFIRSLTLTFS